jgi:hypothetical protein
VGERVSDRGSVTSGHEAWGDMLVSEHMVFLLGYCACCVREPLPGEGDSGTARTSGQVLRISARRSPMITHGAWVLPVVMVGMIEPSAMRSFFTP